MAGPFFGGEYFGGGFFQTVVSGPTVYYGVGRPVYKRHKKKYDTAVLFADIEWSLRQMVYGPAVSDDVAAPVVAQPVAVVDVPSALETLADLAEDRADLQRRLAALRHDLQTLEAEIRQRERQRQLDDEDEILMVL